MFLIHIFSLDFIKIIVKLEDEFSIEVDNDKLSKEAFCSLSNFIQYIENLEKSRQIKNVAAEL